MRQAALFAVGLALLAAAAPAAQLELKPCTDSSGLPPEARCGVYEVWENRAARSGRKIPLRVLVLPATGPDRLPDALTFFGGGPGESNVGAVQEALDLFGDLRKQRDILLVDFRGTGGPAGLFCPDMQGSAGVQGLLDHYYPPDKVKACAELLSRTADLSQYTNDSSVDDFDEVRAALGYPQINIYGGSGGSRSALVYLRRHPDKVRAVVVSGLAPTDEQGPFFMARHAQRALDGLIAECAADAACRGAFPRLRDDIAAVFQRVDKEPVTVTLTDGETGKPVELRLSRRGVAQTLRYMLYRPLAAAMIPLSFHLAAQGDWKLLAETGAHFASGRSFGGIADGYYLSLTCGEDVPHIREEEIPAAVQGTFLGELRIRMQQAACANWPVPPVDRKFLEPVVSDVPTLLISGERDPVTPPSLAERTARTLKNSVSVVVPDAGHGFLGIAGSMECIDSLITRFLQAGTVKGLDTSCLARTKRPEFVLKHEPEVVLPAAQLARLTGTYREPKSGREARIATAGQRLHLLEAEYPPTVLVATAPDRFHMEGTPSNYAVRFQIPATGPVTFTLPWAPEETYIRAGEPAAAHRLELKPCTDPSGLPPEARCGVYEVWENRAARSGRKIPLRVLVLPATGPDRLPDALTLFTGGPGESNVAAAPEALQMFASLRERRDILLVDFRGTGGPAGLFCPEMQGSAGAQGLLDHFYPPDKVKVCFERLAKTADLSQYNNDNSVDDIDEVRAALGYEKLDIYGGSGGSRSTLIYLRRHPGRVRTAVIAGVVPPDERGPFSMARHAQRALDGLIAECAADAACRDAFPRLREEVAAVLRQAEKEPVSVPLIDGETGQPVEVRLTRNGVSQTLRYMLYRPLSAALIPLSFHLAAQGDWTLLAETGVHYASGREFGGLADGYYLSLTCSEDVPFIREDEIPAAVRGTFLGDLRIRKQQQACAAWPVPPVDRSFLEPVVADVPTLLISGERDPVTPPGSAERAARTLRNSLSIVIPDAGHGSFGVEGALECTDGIMARFIEAGTVQGLDTSCLPRTKRPAFVQTWEPEVKLAADQMARLAGSYKEPTGREIRIEAVGQRLHLREGEYPPTVLIPIASDRFRVEGMPPSNAVKFQTAAGGAATLTTPWEPEKIWERQDG